MPRRKSAKRDVGSDSDGSSPEPDTKIKRKKRKVATKLNKNVSAQQPKSRALLQLMLDMPVDVLLEVGTIDRLAY